MFQISSSVWVTPQAGMPVILMPCLITQNCSAALPRFMRHRTGGFGFMPGRISFSARPGARWQAVHIAS